MCRIQLLFTWDKNKRARCCVFRIANACLRIRSHGWKTMKNFVKWWKMCFSENICTCTWVTHVEKSTKTTKFPTSNQPLGVTTNFWPTNFFLRFSSCVSHEPLVGMMEKVLFSSFYNVFHHFRPCECMCKYAFADWNTQQLEAALMLIYCLCFLRSKSGYKNDISLN